MKKIERKDLKEGMLVYAWNSVNSDLLEFIEQKKDSIYFKPITLKSPYIIRDGLISFLSEGTPFYLYEG